MAETYTLHVAGLTRELPICKVNDHMDIAAFIMFSDVELTVACAAELLKKVPEFDVILTAEAKGIPLAYEMSRQSGKQWLPARKGAKLYMQDPVVNEDESITTAGKQVLVMDRKDIEYMNGKRILIVDDVAKSQNHAFCFIRIFCHVTLNCFCPSDQLINLIHLVLYLIKTILNSMTNHPCHCSKKNRINDKFHHPIIKLYGYERSDHEHAQDNQP